MAKLKWVLRLGFLGAILLTILLAMFVLQRRWQALSAGQFDLVDGGAAGLNVVERIYLQTYLASKSEALEKAAGSGSDPILFVVAPGESADQIAQNLAAAQLIVDPELFTRYVRYHGLDSELEAGEFTLSPRFTISEMANSLTQAFAREVELRFLEGWRLEQMAEYLDTVGAANIDAFRFLAIAQRQTDYDLSAHDFLASLTPDATLEGFLFPDTYLVPLDADADYLIDKMLQNFGRRVSPAMRQSYGYYGLSLGEAVTLASIVEREAVVPAERPVIAGVFYNRLAQGMKLEADPTTQYALGYQPEQSSWWKRPLFLDDLAVESPYNTYQVEGLPPGPIANPSLSSLEAVANPVTSDFIFFVADCTAEIAGSHAFSVTYEEHLSNVQQCR